MDLDRADKLLMLATDESTTEDERRTAAVELVRMMKKENFLAVVRRASDLADELGRRLNLF